MSKIAHLLECSAEEVNLIYEKFKVSAEHVRKSVGLLQLWLEQSPHLARVFLEEEPRFLEGLLMFCKFSVERTKNAIETYFRIQQKYFRAFRLAIPSNPDIGIVNQVVYCVPMPRLTNRQERISIFKVRDKVLMDKHRDKSTSILTYCYLMMHMHFLHDYQSANVAIIDFEGVSMEHLVDVWQHSDAFVKLLKPFVRIQAIHVINPPTFTSFVVNLISTVNSEIAKRVIVHSKLEYLQDYFSKDLLPPEIEGSGHSLEKLNGDWLKAMKHREDFFHRLIHKAEKYYDENSVNNFSDFVDSKDFKGTFRNLDVD